MDVGELLRSARSSARLSKTALARRAGTSPAALLAYESGRRSPTVATLARVLAACGLQLRGELEPLHADLDREVEQGAAAEPLYVDWGLAALISALSGAGVSWALDGRSAMAAHGVGAAPWEVDLAVVDNEALRLALVDAWARPVDHRGLPIGEHWCELDLTALGPQPMYTRYRYVRLRVVEELARVVPVVLPRHPEDVDPGEPPQPDVRVPVLSLVEVELAHPGLAQVLGRLRERRRTVVA